MRKRSDGLHLVPPLHRATHRVGLHLQALRLGVSQGEAHVLAHLEAAGPSTISALHTAFAHRRSTLTSILDRLEGAGLVRREVHAGDRRSFLVSLTARGRVQARRIHAALADLEARVARRVRAADLAGFETVVEALQQVVLSGRRGGKT
ncbi:MAG TPA: MarR family transcriptional regulator [Candidatus Binatia bacterium]|jgi:DNA-binding MarR family transcriptional regulator